MIIRREETWGEIQYNTIEHCFSFTNNSDIDGLPYSKDPVLLNIDLTLKCNMNCPHCVAKDFDELRDLKITDNLIKWINDSPFLVIVITGGEPFLPEFENQLITLLTKIKNKGTIIDTNGTIIPSKEVLDVIKDTNSLVRISWDSVIPKIEGNYRKFRANESRESRANLTYFFKKFDLMKKMQKEGIFIAIQTVLNETNRHEIIKMIDYIKEQSIKKWYIQRFIPAHKRREEKHAVTKSQYYEITSQLKSKCEKNNIEIVIKKDLRHNCVLLLVGDGEIYTQSQKPGKKIRIGSIYDPKIEYFNFVSGGDHAERYYGE